ncbi:hypothetical protein JD844_003963 [Phrynosoma platyrhinos]|uniref:Uncharacterized protein n=1 Tax=Phrynosoma platyrhinos TaxID=52577 RepID=A0ABQ7TMV3_PHRPL|nr:hypothetical protein JD844_003963 [Phrynosoma platyrhinos]
MREAFKEPSGLWTLTLLLLVISGHGQHTTGSSQLQDATNNGTQKRLPSSFTCRSFKVKVASVGLSSERKAKRLNKSNNSCDNNSNEMQPGPPFNFVAQNLTNNQLLLSWKTPYKSYWCLEHQVKYRSNKDDEAWTILIGVGSLCLLMVLVVTLLRMERVRLVLMPAVPNPSKKFEELFTDYHGNFSEWVGVSKDAMESFRPTCHESICYVSEIFPSGGYLPVITNAIVKAEGVPGLLVDPIPKANIP